MSKANLNDPNLDKMKAVDIPDVVGESYHTNQPHNFCATILASFPGSPSVRI